MARMKSIQDVEDQAGKLPTGVEGQNIPTDFYIPPVGITDVDRAVFTLFDKRLRLTTTTKQQTVKVPVIVAGGERFALLKKNRPIKDRTGTFILPLISIRRTGLEQSKPGVIPGRGMGQDTGDLVIKKHLSQRDSRYQALVNKLRLKNQDNVASLGNQASLQGPQGSDPGTLATRRSQPRSINTVTGDLLAPDLSKNIFEIITIPFPRFYTALYEITFWSQHVIHMNQMLERFMTSYDAQGNQFRLDTDKGYWFVGYVDDAISSGDNFDDYTERERVIKYSVTMRVPAYLMASERHGSGVPFRSYLSAPQISFEVDDAPQITPSGPIPPVGSGDVDKFVLSTVDVLDRRGDRVEDTRQAVQRTRDVMRDPFSGKEDIRYLRILSKSNRKGERVLSKRFITELDDVDF